MWEAAGALCPESGPGFATDPLSDMDNALSLFGPEKASPEK